MPDQHKSSKREHPVKQPAKRVHGVAHHQSVSHHSAATSRTPPLTQIAKAQYSLWRSSQRLLQRSEDEALKRRLDDRCHAAMAIAQRSACPSGRWQDAVAPLLVQRAAQQSLIFVDVGANKGYNVAQFLQRYSRPEANFMSHWSEAIRPHVSAELPPGAPSRSRHAGPHYSLVCGNCWSCFAGPPPKLNQYPPNVRVHAIDIVAKNVALMKTALTALRVPESAARLHHLAMSNESGSVTLADSGGLETSSIAAQGSSGASAGNSGVRVPAATLDEFASTHLQPQPQQKGGGDAASHAETVIDHLTIDAEGHDPSVLSGASRLLALRRIRVLEFEYNAMGAWLSEGALRRTLERLRGWKYECFWQGNFGHLARASGGSWCAEFEFKRWSNLVCAHEPAVLAALGALAI